MVRNAVNCVSLAVGVVPDDSPGLDNDYNSIGNMRDVINWLLDQLKMDINVRPRLLAAQPASSSAGSPRLRCYGTRQEKIVSSVKDAKIEAEKKVRVNTKARAVSVDKAIGKL